MMSGEIVLSWIATYMLHSTLMIGAAWLATRRGPLAASTARDAIWKIATIGALLTTTLQIAVPFGGAGIDLRVPDASAVAREPTRISETGVVAAEGRTLARQVPSSIETGEPALEKDLPVEVAGRDGPSSVLDAGPTNGTTIPSAEKASPSLPGLSGAALVVWLVTGGALLLRHVVRRRRFARRLGPRRSITWGPAREALDDLLRKANAGRRVRLTATEALASPVALHGNEICVPDRALGHLDPRALRALLAHELAHLERRDPLWLEVAATLESLLFFQPLHRLGRRELRSAAEEECDAWAAGLTGERHALARCLVEVAGWMQNARMAEATGMAEPGKGLERRVERLIAPVGSGSRGSSWAGAITALGLVVAIACGGPAVRPAEDEPAPIEPESAIRPDRASPPSVVAVRPTPPSAAGVEAPAMEAASPDTLERSRRVREYVFGEDGEEPWFAFDWSPGDLEELERLGKVLERSLEPLEDFEFRFDGEMLEGFDLEINAPEIWLDLPQDTLRIRALGKPGAVWASAFTEGLKVRIEGEVEWGEGKISSIAPGGRVEIHEAGRRLIVTPGAEDELLFDYEVDGRPHGFDAEGREWLAAVIERIRKAEKSGRSFQVGAAGAPEAWARALRGREFAARAAERRAELEELRAGQRTTALRARLRALEAEMNRLREEIERLEADSPDS